MYFCCCIFSCTKFKKFRYLYAVRWQHYLHQALKSLVLLHFFEVYAGDLQNSANADAIFDVYVDADAP